MLTRIRGEVEKQLRDSCAPQEIHDFLVQHWSRLMTNIFMVKGNRDPDWQAGWDTMNALIWSLAPKHGRRETTLMLRSLPNLLARLQEGCSALGLPATVRDILFEQLAMLHAAVAREGLQAHKTAHAQDADAAEADGELSTGIDLNELPLPTQSPDGLPRSTSREEQAPLPELSIGDRISLRVAGEDRPMLLNWVSPMGGMYLFTNEHGLDALTLTRARLEAKFHQGEARLVS
ncbi:MAG: DUF1631 family protein [Pseudomonadota bacterium]